MKKTNLFGAILFFISMSIFAQDKKEMKKLESDYVAFTGHSPFFDNKEWAMCKLSIIYKLSTAMTAKAMDKNKEVGAKVKSSSGAYAMLNGISENDLQALTDKVAQNFIKRFKEEAGINIISWSAFKDNKNTAKIIEIQDEKEIYSKSQGLAYAMTYDGTPHYSRIIVLIPGGKKLAKDLQKNVMELTLYVDFAEMVATATADVSVTGRSTSGNTKTTYFTFSEGADQKMKAGVRLVPNLGSEALSEMGKNLASTGLKGHNLYGHMMSVGLTGDLISDKEFVEKMVPNEGKIPEILANRKNNNVEYVKTFDVFTTPEKYGNAVMDVTNKYFDTLIKITKYHQK